jgi:hypothetical protein
MWLRRQSTRLMTVPLSSSQAYHEPISTLKPVKAFSGDQKQFKDF